MKTKRILTLNAGALKAVSQVAILAELERLVRRPVWRIFDCLAGSSAGGINAALLALGRSAGDLSQLYLSPSSRLFKRRWRFWRSLFSPAHFRRVIEGQVPPQVRMGHARVRLVLFAHNLRDGIHYAFSSFDTPDQQMSAVLLRTTAVPPFLEPHDGTWLDPGLGSLFNPTEATLRHLSAKGVRCRGLQVVNLESPLDPHQNSEARLRHGGLQVHIAHVVETLFADLARRAHAGVHYNFPLVKYDAFSFSNDRYYNPFDFADLRALYAEAQAAAPSIAEAIAEKLSL